jgi:transcription elongation factor Elf1
MEYYPKRLAWVQDEDICMFCENPKGSSLTNYVCMDEKLGYISCVNCEQKMEEAVKLWHKHYDINHLKNTDIKIKRSSGEIESGWRLLNPITINSDDAQIQKIYCINETEQLTKWCRIDDILSLNPREDLRNLCINCGVDMGADNPRQLCCKSYCPN